MPEPTSSPTHVEIPDLTIPPADIRKEPQPDQAWLRTFTTNDLAWLITGTLTRAPVLVAIALPEGLNRFRVREVRFAWHGLNCASDGLPVQMAAYSVNGTDLFHVFQDATVERDARIVEYDAHRGRRS